ncbi:MAG: hypothetical protein WCD18_20110, partial [Thermosynechococcaceae cyanobacterium]
QPVASQPFPKPSVPASAIQSPSKVALVRPTNPDDRLRVIKSGRNDPFALLVQPSSPNTAAAPSAPEKKPQTQEEVGKKLVNSYDKFLDRIAGIYGKPGDSGSKSGAIASNGLPGTINLPSLPQKPEMANVKVTGVVVVAGLPRAIVQAPDEPTSRTVGIGDSLSGGKLYVKNIDLSNRAEPVVIFQQGGTEFAVAVGRDPVLLASADPTAPGVTAPRPVRGLYTVQSR